MEPPDTDLRVLCCPRCGYSLRGEAGLWVECCPLRGRCPECGLEFDWGEVQRQRRLHWLFEHVWREAPVRSFLSTFVATLRPRRFWMRLGLSDAYSGIGCVLFAVSTLLPPALLLVVWNLITVWHAVVQAGARGVSPGMLMNDIWVGTRHDFLRIFAVHFSGLSVVACAITLPAAFVLLPVTRRICRVRARHLMRAACYGFGWLCWLTLAWTGFWLLREAQPIDDAMSYVASRIPLDALSRYFDERHWLYTKSIVLATLPLATWWGLATSRYLRMRHPWLIAAVLGLLAALVAFGAEDVYLFVHFLRGGL